ncbi:hypothetical protein OJF2_35600 [Aquisphaera giovannonii]|uniref:Effector-associated domain-containing protein n=1 Tax=Aquisphaera giovannonii TaxID=406548 RepID=A0A5B9W4I3_9BACT|nr:effector-associated domain EAD1-containing protein [Aquisphaera giovannonii]QEH35015.1 hypothetical protein OJF2_35600 [Aquisphaera giovannonii]
MELTGGQVERLCAAIVEALDEKSLEQLLYFKLGKELFKLVGRGAFKDVVFDLVRLAQREGWLEALVREAAAARPLVPEFRSLGVADAATPRDPARLVEGPVVGIQTLVGLADRHDGATLLAGLGRILGPDIDEGQKRFRLLKKYKVLHDILHFLQFQYLEPIADAVKRFRDDATAYRLLDRYIRQLRDRVADARSEADGLPTQFLEEEWIGSFSGALDDLAGGMKPGAAESSLGAALATLRSLPAEGPRINSALAVMAGQLPLSHLTEAMRQVDGALRAAQDGRADPSATKIRDGLHDLIQLEPKLGGLVREHLEWQWLDKEIGAGDLTQGATAAERVPRWARVRDRLRALCDLSPQEGWSGEIRTLVDALDAPAAGGDPADFARSFNTFRDVTTERFFSIDDELRKLSDDMLRIAAELDTLLEVLPRDDR